MGVDPNAGMDKAGQAVPTAPHGPDQDGFAGERLDRLDPHPAESTSSSASAKMRSGLRARQVLMYRAGGIGAGVLGAAAAGLIAASSFLSSDGSEAQASAMGVVQKAQQENTGPQDTGPQDTGPQDTGPQDTGPQDTGREAGAPAVPGLRGSQPDTGAGPAASGSGESGPAQPAKEMEGALTVPPSEGALSGTGAKVPVSGPAGAAINFTDTYWRGKETVTSHTVGEAIPDAEGVKRMAVIRSLDKVTARTRDLNAPVGVPVYFGPLEITAATCEKKPPEAFPETTAFLDVTEMTVSGVPRNVFSGWMFASNPALNAMEHAVYDVWVIDCITSAPEDGTESAANQASP